MNNILIENIAKIDALEKTIDNKKKSIKIRKEKGFPIDPKDLELIKKYETRLNEYKSGKRPLSDKDREIYDLRLKIAKTKNELKNGLSEFSTMTFTEMEEKRKEIADDEAKLKEMQKNIKVNSYDNNPANPNNENTDSLNEGIDKEAIKKITNNAIDKLVKIYNAFIKWIKEMIHKMKLYISKFRNKQIKDNSKSTGTVYLTKDLEVNKDIYLIPDRLLKFLTNYKTIILNGKHEEYKDIIELNEKMAESRVIFEANKPISLKAIEYEINKIEKVTASGYHCTEFIERCCLDQRLYKNKDVVNNINECHEIFTAAMYIIKSYSYDLEMILRYSSPTPIEIDKKEDK